MRIRLALEADGPAIHAIYAPVVESTAISFEATPPSSAELARRIAAHQEAHPWLVAYSDRGVLGYAYAGPFATRAAYAWSVETSVYVAEAARGRGVGRALYRALLRLLVVQGYRQAMAGISLPNPASVRLHEASGFTQVALYRAAGWKLGAWHDVGWWQRSLRDPAAEPVAPAPPLALSSLGVEALAAALEVDASLPT
jgi:phosphinothricin acetyltransferase